MPLQNLTSDVSSELKTLTVDEQIMIASDISNKQDVQQDFAYLTQVRNDDGVVSLSWLTGSLSPNQSFSPAQSWIPTEPGIFHMDIFVWESITNPDALYPLLSMTVNVIEKNI